MKKINLNLFDWKKIQEKHDNGIFWTKLPNEFKFSRTVLLKAEKQGLIKKVLHEKKHDNESKGKISEARKKYLKNNPDKHPWKCNSKFKSKPCELFKIKLKNENIFFIEEYQPSLTRFYSIDIAFPNKKIGIEINGNQHYNNDGTLKDYYIERNNFLNELGWVIYDIHYSVVFLDEIINDIVSKIKNFSLSLSELELFTQKQLEIKKQKQEKRKKRCVDCNVEIHSTSKKCVMCYNISRRKVKNRPQHKQLLNEINETSYLAVGRKYGVSDKAIRKWLKYYEIHNSKNAKQN